MESNVQTKVYKLTDRMDKYHSSYTSSKYSSYAHSSINENKSKSRNSPHEGESTTYKRYLNSHDVPQTTQTHRDSGQRHHSTTNTTNNVHSLNNRTTNNATTNNNNDELINSMYNHSTALIANATVFPKSRIQDISTREYLNIKSYFEKHILKNPKSIAEKRSSLLISDISSLEGHTNTFVLPRLKIDEFIDSKQVSENVLNISMKWPLEKSGYILRKNIYTKESNNNLNNSNPSVINKIKHSNFLKKDRSSSIKGKLQEHTISPSSSKWLIFYVEIRGPYIFFYQLIRKKPVITSKPMNSLKPKHSVMNKMSIENLRKNLVEKPLSRILSISKSSASRRQVKMIEASPSSTTQTTDDDNFIPTYPTNPNQHHHHASLICTVNDISGPLEILSAKKVLVHYIPLYYSIITPVITDNNPNILALSTIQGIDLKEEEPKYLLDQMLIEISNIGVSHVHSFIEETSIVVNKSFNLTSLMQTEVQNWQNSLKQGSFIHSDDDLFESINFVSEHKNANINVMDHYESRHATENPTEDLYTDLKNYTFPHVPKKESSSSSTSSKEKKEKGKDKIKSIHNQYTQKFFNYCKQIDDTASYHSSSSSNNSITSSHKRSENNLNEAFLEKRDNSGTTNNASSPNVFKNRPKAYSISSENPFAKKTTSGNIIEKTKTRKPSIDTDIHLEDGKKLNNTDNDNNNNSNNNNNLLSPSRYYRKYSMPEFINNFSSFSNSKYIKSSSSSIKSTSSANKIEASVAHKKSNDIYEINREYKLESSKSSSNNNNNNNNNKKSSELRDIMHVSSPTESKTVSPATVNVTDVTPKFAKTSLAMSTARTATNYLSEITHRYKNAEPPTPVNDRYKNIDLDSPTVDAQVPTPSLFINNNMINLDEITDQANELINAGSSSSNNNKKVKKEKKSKKNKDKVKKNLISAPVLLAHDGANGSSLPGQVGNKVLSISTRPLNVVSKDLKTYTNPALIDYASNPTKENRNKLIMNATSTSATTTTATASTPISTTGTDTGVGATITSTPSVTASTAKASPTFTSNSTTTPSIQVPKKSENIKSKFYSPFINAITKSNHKSLYSSSPTKNSSSKMGLSLNTKLLKTNSKDSLRINKNNISSPIAISKPNILGSGHEEKKMTTEFIRSKSINTNTGINTDIGIGTNSNTNTGQSKSKNRNVAIDDIDEGLKLDLKNNLKYEEKLNQFLDGGHTDPLSSKKEEMTIKNKESPISPININTSFYIKSFDTKSNALNRFSFPSTVTENLPEVPILLQKCVELVEKIGLRTEGIYRLSGNSATVQSLRKKFELDPFKVNLISPTYKEDYKDKDNVDRVHRRYSHAKSKSTTSIPLEFSSIESPNNLYDNDIHVVTGCIKSYLRDGIGEDHVPVCTYDLYQEFINASQIKDYRERMIKFQDIVHTLPGLNFVTLRFICQHLYRVSLYSTVNRMTIKNLAIIFGPTLLKPLPVIESAQRLIEDMKRQCEAVEILIENHEFLFGKIEYEEVTDSEDKGSVDYDKKAVAKVQEYIDNNTTYDSRRPITSSKYMLSSSPKVTSPITPTTPTMSTAFRSPSLSSSPLSSSTKHFFGSSNNNNTNIVGSPKSSSSIKYSRDFFEKKSSPQTISSRATATTASNSTTIATTTIMTPSTSSNTTMNSSSPTSSYKLYLDKKSSNTSPSASYKLYSEKKPYNTSSKLTTTYKPYSITTNFGSSSNSSNKHDIRPSTPTKYDKHDTRPSTPTKYDKHDIRPSTPTNHSIISTSMEPINLNLEKSIFDSLKFNTSTSEEPSPKLTRKSYDNYMDSSSPKLTRKSYDDYKDSSSPKISIKNHKSHDENDETLVTKNLILNLMKEDKTSENDIGSKYLRTNNKSTYSSDEKNINTRKTSKVILPSEDSLVKPPRISSKLSSALDDVKPLRTMNKFNSPVYKSLSVSKSSNTGSSLRKEMNRPTLPPKSNNEFINKKLNISSPNTNTNKINTITSSSSTEVTSGSLSNEKDVEVIYLSNAKTSHSNRNHLFDEIFDQRPSEKVEKTNDILLPSIIIPSLTGQEEGLKTHLDLTNHSNELEDDILSPTKDYNKTHLDLTDHSDELEDEIEIITPTKDYKKIHADFPDNHANINVNANANVNEFEDEIEILSSTKDYDKTHLDLTNRSDVSFDMDKDFTTIISNEKNTIDDSVRYTSIVVPGESKLDEPLLKFGKEKKNKHRKELSLGQDFKTDLELGSLSSEINKEFNNISHRHHADDDLYDNEPVNEPVVKKSKSSIDVKNNELNNNNINSNPSVGEIKITLQQPVEEFKEESKTIEQPIEEFKEESKTIEQPVVVVEETIEEQPTEEVKEEEVIEQPVVEETVEEQPIEEVKEEEVMEQPVVVEETMEEQSTEEFKEEEIIEQPVETIEEQPTEEVKKEEIIEQPVETIEEQPTEEVKEEEIIEQPVVVEETMEEQSTEEVKEEEIIEQPVVVEETIEEQPIKEVKEEEVIEQPVVVEETVEEQPIKEVKEEEVIEQPVVVEETIEEQPTEKVKEEEIIEQPVVVEETVEEQPIKEVKEEEVFEQPVVVEETVEEQPIEEVKEEEVIEQPVVVEETVEEQPIKEVKEEEVIEQPVVVEETVEEQPIEEIKEEIIEQPVVVVEETIEEQPTGEVKEEIVEPIVEEAVEKQPTEEVKEEIVEPIVEEAVEEQPTEEEKEEIVEPIVEEAVEEQPTEEVKEEIIEQPVIVEEQSVEEVNEELIEQPTERVKVEEIIEQSIEDQPTEEFKDEIIEQPVVVEETVEEQPIEIKDEIIEHPIVAEETVEELIEEVKEEIEQQPIEEQPTEEVKEEEIIEQPVVIEEVVEEQPVEVKDETIEKPIVVEETVEEPTEEVKNKIEQQQIEEQQIEEQPTEEVKEEEIIEQPVEVKDEIIEQPIIIEKVIEEQPIESNDENIEQPVVEEAVEKQPTEEVKEEIIEPPVVVEETVEEQLIKEVKEFEKLPTEEVKEEIIEQPIVIEEAVEKQPTEEAKEEIIEQPVVEEETIKEQPIEEVKDEIIEQPVIIEETVEEQPIKEVKEEVIEQSIEERKEEINEQPVIAEEVVEEQQIEEVKEEIIEQPVIVEETIEEQPAKEVKDEIIEQPIVVGEAVEEQPTEEVKEEEIVEQSVEEQTTEEVKEEEIVEQPVVEEVVEEQQTEEVTDEIVEQPVVVEEKVEEPVKEVKDEIILQPIVVEETVEELNKEVKEEVIEQPVIKEIIEEPIEEVKEEAIEQPIVEETIEELTEEVKEEAIEQSISEETVKKPIEEVKEEEIIEQPDIVKDSFEEQPFEEVKDENVEPFVEEAVEEPTGEVKEETIEQSISEETVKKPIEEVKDEIVEPLVEEAVEEPTEEVKEEVIEQSISEETVKKTFEEVKGEIVEPIVEEAVEELTEEVKEEIIEQPISQQPIVVEESIEQPIERIKEVPFSEIRVDNGLWWLFVKPDLNELSEIKEEINELFVEEPLVKEDKEIKEVNERPVVEEDVEEQPTEKIKEKIIKPIVEESIEQSIGGIEEILYSEIRADNGLWWLFVKPELNGLSEIKEEVNESFVKEPLIKEVNEEVKDIIEQQVVEEAVEEQQVEEVKEEAIEQQITEKAIKEQQVEEVKEEIIVQPIIVEETVEQRIEEVPFSEIRADNGLWWLFAKPELNEFLDIKEKINKSNVEEPLVKEVKEFEQPIDEVKKEIIEQPVVEEKKNIDEIKEEIIKEPITTTYEIKSDNGLWWLFAKLEYNKEEIGMNVEETKKNIIEKQPNVEMKEEKIEIPAALKEKFNEQYIEEIVEKIIEVPEDEKQPVRVIKEKVINQPITEKQYLIDGLSIIKIDKEEFEIDDNDYHLIEKHLSEVVKPEDIDFNLSDIPEEKTEEEYNILSDIIEEQSEEIEDESDNENIEKDLEFETEIFHINNENNEVKE